MALIIKGEMPTSCGFCVECRGGGNEAYYCNTVKKHIADVVPPYDKRMEWCPIKGEIPDKHGRLIDFDEFTKSYDYGMFPNMTKEQLEYWINESIDDAKIVLEASK